MHCSECDKLEEGVPDMVAHILATHPDYTPQEAAQYAHIWADSAYYEELEARDAWNGPRIDFDE